MPQAVEDAAFEAGALLSSNLSEFGHSPYISGPNYHFIVNYSRIP
jgi:hypothetical protein